MTWTPSVTFEDTNAASLPNDQDIEKTLAQGVVSNSGLSMYQAMKRPDFGQRVPYAQARLSRRVQALRPHLHARAIEVSDPSLDRSDETAVAINPRHPHNIVAGAASFDGTQFTNTAYVTKDGGRTWKTVVALANTSEGAGIAFDDSNNCYYTTMRGGFFPVCVVSKDGGLTWSQPAAFGFGDKTAVAARGQTALCGFDRINIEACAFTLDGGATWTVHDFTDRGIGTAPLISYDQQHFYIIYAALDQNLKMYASSDQGQTWAGPMTIVAGNASQSAIVGPLSYEGGALTSPGTNVAIDGRGRLHVLYIDSAKQLPMYTTSHDHGATWSAPEDVNPKRAGDAHMWPCLSCTRHGDLQAGSLVFDQALGKYSILQHLKGEDDDEWTTREVDNGPWAVGGPSPSFRIGFGDYFDCDSLPQCGTTVMAWSETPNGQQPWQTWVHLSDACECREDRLDALEDEIERLTEAFDNHELPFPRTEETVEKFQSKLSELRDRRAAAQTTLERCREANPSPEDSQ
ncbi:MAG TPA: hypothetical protein VF317_04785 [Dermatophilaceae bacterium]